MISKKFPFRLFAAGLLLACSPGVASAVQLISDGTFVTNPATITNNYSNNVASFGTTPSNYAYQFIQTISGNVGWVTNEPSVMAPTQMEVWKAGFLGSPVNSNNTNTLELANYTADSYVRQDATSLAGSGTLGSFSFGYFARDGGGINAFGVMIVDMTHTATVVSQSFNPTVANAETLFNTTFAVTPGDVYRVTFTDADTDGGSKGAHIDNVSFTQVPEPGTLACGALAIGALVLGWTRRRGLHA